MYFKYVFQLLSSTTLEHIYLFNFSASVEKVTKF